MSRASRRWGWVIWVKSNGLNNSHGSRTATSLKKLLLDSQNQPNQNESMLSPLILAHLISLNLASIFILRTVVQHFWPIITAIVAAIGSQRWLEHCLTLCCWFGSNATTFFRECWASNRKFSSFDSFSFWQAFVALVIVVELLLGHGYQQQIVPPKTWQSHRWHEGWCVTMWVAECM